MKKKKSCRHNWIIIWSQYWRKLENIGKANQLHLKLLNYHQFFLDKSLFDEKKLFSVKKILTHDTQTI
jgi:hypothetical protein